MKELQNGRSMIEMLGVLAIIGVLSIGGLAGYTMAMNRHRANTILDYVSRCVVIAQTSGDGSTVKTGPCATILGEDKPGLLSEDGDVAASGNDIKVTLTPANTKVAEILAGRTSDAIKIENSNGAVTITFVGVGDGSTTQTTPPPAGEGN